MTSARTAWHGIALVVAMAASALNACLLRTLDVAGIPFVFATAMLVQLLLIVLLAYNLVIFLRAPLGIAVLGVMGDSSLFLQFSVPGRTSLVSQ